jgi:hypothetical protein
MYNGKVKGIISICLCIILLALMVISTVPPKSLLTMTCPQKSDPFLS